MPPIKFEELVFQQTEVMVVEDEVQMNLYYLNYGLIKVQIYYTSRTPLKQFSIISSSAIAEPVLQMEVL